MKSLNDYFSGESISEFLGFKDDEIKTALALEAFATGDYEEYPELKIKIKLPEEINSKTKEIKLSN